MPNNTIKIPLYKPIYGEKPLEINGNITINSDGNTVVSVSKKDGEEISKGTTLTFRRYADRGDRVKTISGTMIVLDAIDNGKNYNIILEGKLEPEKLYPVDIVYHEMIDGKWSLVDRELTDAEIKDGLMNGTLTIYESPYYPVSDLEGKRLGTAVRFTADHNIFLQDLSDITDDIKLNAYDAQDRLIRSLGTIPVKILKEDGYSIAVCDDLVIRSTEINCRDEEKVDEIYTYLPESFLTDTILLEGKLEADLVNVAYFKATENPFFGKDGSFWGPGCGIDVFNEPTVFLNRDYGFWNVPVQIMTDEDSSSLGLSDLQEDKVVNDEINRNIPPIINMEKCKFVPMFKDENDNLRMITEIEINMHFRKRAPMTGDTGVDIGQFGDKIDIPFKDGWYIDPDNESKTGWFENEEKESDLLGYLGFDDNDIFYQKSKISKSFIRLSYYNNPDPLNQSLLNYSTVFFNSGEIYGKYLRQKEFVESLPSDEKWNHAVGLYPKGIRVDSKLLITNEFDKSKCAEGFNVYLFAEDAPLGDEEVPDNGILEDGKNYEKPIYLKVEFNHAKTGKTIPLITNGEESGISVDKYLDSLYIKLWIGYNIEQGIYYYRIPQSEHIKREGTKIILTLFEPKLKRGE